jgi:predicted ATP-binding protein involved in virulence
MHIQQVKIKNFRCFEDLTVNLNPDVNIFVGNNGSGKSAVLDAIIASIYPYLHEFQDIDEDKDLIPVFQRDLLIKNNGKSNGIVEFTVEVTGLPRWTVIYTKEENSNNDDRLHIKYKDSKITIFDRDFFRNINTLKSNSQFDIFVLAYYKGNRNLANITDLNNLSNKLFANSESLTNIFDAIADFTDLANWFFIREFQELREGKNRGDINYELPDLKQIRKAISIIVSPNARVYFSRTDPTKLMVEWETEIGEKIELSLNQLSSGYRNMLALVMDFARRLAQANPQMENPLEAEAVLMIDEIDLHLHPTWQQKIIPDLRKVFPNTQIIATTHSPEIVTTVERHQVKILEDYQIKECPSPTRGMKSSDVLRYVLGLDNLRPDTEESRTLTALFEAIDNGNLEEAKRLRDKLQDWKSFDPDITRADMQIRRLEREMTA